MVSQWTETLGLNAELAALVLRIQADDEVQARYDYLRNNHGSCAAAGYGAAPGPQGYVARRCSAAVAIERDEQRPRQHELPRPSSQTGRCSPAFTRKR